MVAAVVAAEAVRVAALAAAVAAEGKCNLLLTGITAIY